MLPQTDPLLRAQIHKARILIVDDQPAHLNLLEQLLRETGYINVSATQDPQTVCARHSASPFDLILLDLQMPALDGFGVMEGLRATSGDSYLPVIALTAQPGHKVRALQAGARDFISKPFDMIEVKIRIHHMLEVRLLHKMLAAHNEELERIVQERTEQLRASEASYRSLTELAADWYWEQDRIGEFTKVYGPALEILGLVCALSPDTRGSDAGASWDTAERQKLQEHIAARRPFLDFILHRRRADGSQQQFRISGQPFFDERCGFAGYRGFGAEVLSAPAPVLQEPVPVA